MPAEFALFGARGEVPEFDHLRPRQREPLAIGMDRQLVDPPSGSREPKRLTAGHHVPDLDVPRVRARVAAVARDDRPAIGRDGQGHDGSACRGDRFNPAPEHRSGLRIPDDDPIAHTGCDPGAIRADRQGGHDAPGCPHQRPPHLSRGQVPDADARRLESCVIVNGRARPGHEPRPVGAERDRLHAK